MKLHATISDVDFDVEVRREGQSVYANVAGREYELEMHPSPSGITLLMRDGKLFDCRVDGQAASGQSVDVLVGATHHAVTLIDPKRLRGVSGGAAHHDEAVRIMAAMPGKVVRVLVEQGASVEAGAGIVVVEAMKMQNEMKSPKAGTVTSLNVEVGATVNAGDVLAMIE